VNSALILGYGRAGKRHAKLLQKRGIDVDIYDKNLPEYSTVNSDLPRGYDFCVITTPPSAHLEALRSCMQYEVPVLLEKPLCGFFEGFADVIHYKKASICFNYRYHPAVQALKDSNRS
jgi:predicted dehydrogenase